MHRSSQTIDGLATHILESSLDSIVLVDDEGKIIEFNPAAEQAFGYTRSEVIDKVFTEVIFPERLRENYRIELDPHGGSSLGKRIETIALRSDGLEFPVELSVLCLKTNHKPIFTVFLRNITEQKHFEEALKESETRFRTLFEQAPISIQLLLPNGHTVAVNRAWMQLWNVDQTVVNEFILKEYNVFNDPQVTAKGIMSYIKRGLSGETITIPPILYDPAEIGNPGRVRWTRALMYPLKDAVGNVRELVCWHDDVTDRMQAEATLKLLAETSELLATALDYQATLEKIAKLAINHFGGLCVIHTVSEDEAIRPAVIAHRIPEQIAVARELENLYPVTAEAAHGPAKVLRTRESEFFPQTPEATLLTISEKDRAHLGTIRMPNLRSYMCVPLVYQRGIYGTILLVSTDRLYNEQDLTLAREFAHRAAIAIDNARLYNEAQKAIELREEFMSIASHELKTPLTPLKMQLQLLTSLIRSGLNIGGQKGELLQRFINDSDQQITRLTRLIEDMLDASRIRSGHLTLKLEEVELSQLTRDVLERFHSQAKTSQCPIAIHAQPSVRGQWDRFRMEQVVTNLLTNAMKYGAGKPIEVSIFVEAGHAKLSVRDFGIGIAKKDQSRIFERFGRAVSVKSFGGIGLGLYITRQIVQAHGGTIQVESELGKGSVFTVELPFR